jgi:hypothetical protein
MPNEYQIDITRSKRNGVDGPLRLGDNRLLRVAEISSIGSSANLGIDNAPVLSERLRYAKNTPIIYSVDFLE